MQNKTQFYWKEFSFPISYLIFNTSIIEAAVVAFRKESLTNKTIKNNPNIFLLFLVEYEGGILKTFGKINKINLQNDSNINQYIQTIGTWFYVKSDQYKQFSPLKLIIKYKVIPNSQVKSDSPILHNPINYTTHGIHNSMDITKFTDIQGYKFPNTMDLLEWGDIRKIDENRFHINYILDSPIIDQKQNLILIVDRLSNNPRHHKIEVNRIDPDNSNLISIGFTFEDQQIHQDSFIRKINTLEYVYQAGEIVIEFNNKNLTFLKPKKVDRVMSNNVITFDIETRNIDNKLIPYCISSYDGIESKSFYLTDYINHQEMIKAALLSFIQPKYDMYTIFAHNLYKFDGIFIIPILADLHFKEVVKVDVIKRDDAIMNIGIE